MIFFRSTRLSGRHTSQCIKSSSTTHSRWTRAKHGCRGLCFTSPHVASTFLSPIFQDFVVAMPATYTMRNRQSMSSNFRTTRQRPHIRRNSGTGASVFFYWTFDVYLKHMGQAACLARTERTCITGPCTRSGLRCLIRLEPICRAWRL
jgi:hypothetical protein